MQPDRNDEIRELINGRLELGRERYGHGIRPSDDTRQWGTKVDSWAEMALEEALDLSIYLSAELLRVQDLRRSSQEQYIAMMSENIDEMSFFFVKTMKEWHDEKARLEDEVLTLREQADALREHVAMLLQSSSEE